MKIRIIILSMAASLLLPLAGAYARIAPDSAVDQSGSGIYLSGQTVDKGVMKRRGSRDRGSKGSKGSKRSKGSKGTKGSKGSKGSASDS